MSFHIWLSFFFTILPLSIIIVSNLKIKAFILLLFLLFGTITYEIFNNNYGVFELEPSTTIIIDKMVYDSFQKYHIEIPKIKIHRFLTKEVFLSKNKIILPADYVRFNKKDYNIIFLRYIENVTFNKKHVNEINNIIQTAKNENKKYILPFDSNKLIIKRNLEEVAQILKDGGETSCYFNFSKLQKECNFKTIEKLNLDRTKYISAENFNENLEYHFDQLVDARMEDNTYSPYIIKNIAFNIEDPSFSIYFM